MIWTNEMLSEVEEWAKHGFTITEIALALDLDEDQLQTEFLAQSDFFKAYKKGQLTSALDMRKSVFDLAGKGHSDSQKRAQTYLNKQKSIDG